MIEQNKYTDETIHVANWLLGTGEAERLVESARQDAATLTPAEAEEIDYDEYLRHMLVDSIDERFMHAFSRCLPDGWACNVGELAGLRQDSAFYRNAGDEELIYPFVGQAVAGLCLEDVAEIILEHVTFLQPA